MNDTQSPQTGSGKAEITLLDILKLLKEQDRSGQELAKELGISQGTVSHHLNVLVRDEFIRIAKDGSRLRCSLAPEAIESMVDDIRRLLL